jgi:hypothetical protein
MNKFEGCINGKGITSGPHGAITHGLWPSHMQDHKPHDIFSWLYYQNWPCHIMLIPSILMFT